MRRPIGVMVGVILLGAVLVVFGTLAGCPAGHDDYPGTACKINSDCYQGEVCNGTICVPNLDMSIMGDFAHPPLPSDGGTDLQSIDDMTPVDL
jgi:hypothetical protein